ncbi:discoidin domain-containing protein [Colwellia sp. E2M01]|nr:discoidin domain-containing protein [Colwellia sp. E2M01]
MVESTSSTQQSGKKSAKTLEKKHEHQHGHNFQQVVGLSPKESHAAIVVQDGFKTELVAHEPMVEEPVLMTFDGKGRMYVAEMLTYMQDADGSGQMEPLSRIKRLEDTNNDGVADSFTIFADNLLLPRMVLALEDGKILVRETNTFDLLLIEDLDGDGISDKRTTIFKGGKRGGNLEHQPSGLIWGIDNWLYVTYTNKRYRINKGEVTSQTIRYGGGQWGLGQDEAGRMYYSAASAEQPVFAFQFPSVYGMIPIKGETTEGFNEVFPIENIPDVQGGKIRLRADNTLNAFTGVAGQSIYLGDKLPEIYGNYILPEPVGNLIRSAKRVREDGYTVISHPYQAEKKEFIASTDTAFRPVWSETGPDGTLYIVDMYRGIIQEGNWTKKGSFLRGIIEQFGLAEITGGGRIYRVTKPGVDLGEKPNMYAETPIELTKHLSHENQWWRINAQKLIVLAQDMSVVPELKSIVKTHNNAMARLHALWTLEGLGIIDQDLLIAAFTDSDSNVRTAAVRISEQLVSKSEQGIVKVWKSLIATADIELAQQILLSTSYVDIPEALSKSVRDTVMVKYPNKKGPLAINKAILYQEKAQAKYDALAKGNQALAKALKRGEQNFESLCASCHGADGKGAPAGDKLIAPSFYNNPRVSGDLATLGRIVLQGLSGPIDGETYVGGVMASIASNEDQWIADVLTYIRNNFDNKSSIVTAEQVKSLKEMSARTAPWSLPELSELYSHKLTNKKAWKFSASHNNKDFGALIDGKADWAKWDSGDLQSIGMWLQIELPGTYRISQVDMDCGKWTWLCATPFDLSFSVDGEHWETIDKNIQTSGKRISETLGHEAKFIRFTLKNGSVKQNWVISEVDVFGSAIN